MIVILTVEPKGLILQHCLKRLFDPDFSDPSLLPVSPYYLLVIHIMWSHSAHAQFSVYC
ncbi:unnamed protein product [Staurois parvus]|uniref:Uncharacterized protein n=1 Tax=Staurois parvus TaxID=386267 RepID=A0ABN9DW69_9NEOB|nr:unnamed protein product [Staurois parvus]